MTEDQNAVARPFETLELLAAILLGVAAIATALASYESSLYGGKSVENYSKANKIATSAAAERSRAIVEMARDSQVEMDAWRLTKEGDDAGNPAAEARNYEIATYLYTKVMSEHGYKAMGLPHEARKQEYPEDDTPGAEEKQTAMQEQVLETAMDNELAGNETYRTEMVAKSQALSDEAEKVFKEGQEANEIGDKFQLAAVIFAISLFFGGIVQVFRNDLMRWVILGVGTVLFLGATVYMLRLPWTS
jgi:hypothetical protein